MRRLRFLGVPAVVALTAVACAGDDSADRSTTSTRPGTFASTTSTPSTTALTAEGLRLELQGFGPVRVGMGLGDAARALGRPLEPVTAPTEECTFYSPATGFDGISFLVADGTVARADVTAGTTTTTEGMAIGQTEAEAQRRYGGRLVVTPHDFLLGGSYLTLVGAGVDAGFRLVAETDGVKVTAMRAGRLPEVELTEGCA